MGEDYEPWVPLLPEAYGGCDCFCHVAAGVFHAAPCCYPSDEEELPNDFDAIRDFPAGGKN